MNREIKFRVWDKEIKDWLNAEDHFGNHIYFAPDDESRGRFVGAVFEFCSSTDYVLCQWTGLNDKNNEPVFEGDILKDNLGQIMQVKFQDCEFRLLFANIFGAWINKRDHHDTHTMEIIGNIFENSHLVNTKNEQTKEGD